MYKKITLLVFFIIAFANSQNIIKVKLEPNNSQNLILLYKLKGVTQDFVAYDSIRNGRFLLSVPANAESGMYRVIYDTKTKKYIDLLYDKENIEVVFNPNAPEKTLSITQSESNKIYNNYKKDVRVLQQEINELQTSYFSADEKKRKEITKKYIAVKKQLENTQKEYENKSKGKLVYHFIKTNENYYSEAPLNTPKEYLDNLNEHYFDNIDFNNKNLVNSTLLHEKVFQYIFDVNTSEDKNTLTDLRKKSITTALDKIKSNPQLTKTVQEKLLYNFAKYEDIALANHVLNSYLLLPKQQQDTEFISEIKSQLKTSVGNIAPNINWYDKERKSLHKLSGKPYYLVVFWSSTCSHCLEELPHVKQILDSRNDVQVVAIGLEDDESRNGWKEEIKKYPNWMHVFGENKWKNKYAKSYGVNSTPSFYILDSKKVILAKPEHGHNLGDFFNKK